MKIPHEVIINGVDFADPMTPMEVAALYGVDVKTVMRWENAGKLSSFRTLGGHRRFSRKQVMDKMISS